MELYQGSLTKCRAGRGKHQIHRTLNALDDGEHRIATKVAPSNATGERPDKGQSNKTQKVTEDNTNPLQVVQDHPEPTTKNHLADLKSLNERLSRRERTASIKKTTTQPKPNAFPFLSLQVNPRTYVKPRDQALKAMTERLRRTRIENSLKRRALLSRK
jgi:hypothetical protein